MKTVKNTLYIFLILFFSTVSTFSQNIEFSPLRLYPRGNACYDIDKHYIFKNEDVSFVIIKPYIIKGLNTGKCGCTSAILKVRIFDRRDNRMISEKRIDPSNNYELIVLEKDIANDILMSFFCDFE